MQVLMLAVILVSTVSTYLAQLGVLPGLARFLPELLSVLALVAVLLNGPHERFRYVATRYWLVFGALGAVVICGIIVNHVRPGTLFGGIRFYLRAIPFFFLPAVYAFSEPQLRTQLRWLLGIALLQLPVSLYQRHVVSVHGHWSGDPVSGTLTISSIMSIYLVCSTCVAAALTLRGRMSRSTFLLLFLLFAIPTSINETKSTVLLLPVGLVTTLLAGSPPGRRMRIGLSALGLLALFGVIYVPIYDHFAKVNNPYPYTIEGFFSDQRAVTRYVDQNTDLGTRREAGRWDSLSVPIETFAADPVHLAVGVGIGNGSASSLGAGYTGEYQALFGRYTIETSGAAFIVEIGLVGLLLVLVLYLLVFRDALAVASESEDIVGSIALGWLGVTLIMAIAIFYKSLHYFESLSYLFWYFSGVVAAERMRLQWRANEAQTAARGRRRSRALPDPTRTAGN
jgi:cell division protein FtsW (lipid II flippase)